MDLQSAVSRKYAGQVFDMDQVLTDLLKGMQFSMLLGASISWVEVTAVMNAGFRGQIVHVKHTMYSERGAVRYAELPVANLPQGVVTCAINKLGKIF
jgi:hypothetical protein